jgi:hypothetical protein
VELIQLAGGSADQGVQMDIGACVGGIAQEVDAVFDRGEDVVPDGGVGHPVTEVVDG